MGAVALQDEVEAGHGDSGVASPGQHVLVELLVELLHLQHLLRGQVRENRVHGTHRLEKTIFGTSVVDGFDHVLLGR